MGIAVYDRVAWRFRRYARSWYRLSECSLPVPEPRPRASLLDAAAILIHLKHALLALVEERAQLAQ